MYTELIKVKDVIENQKFVIYGTGSVAKRFSQILKHSGRWGNISHYTVSSLEQDVMFIDGKVVKEIKNVKNDNIVMVAVHNIFADEILENLKYLGFKKVFWIYPHLFDLCFGMPVQSNMILDVKSVVRGLHGVYVHAIYYLAIESEFLKNTVGRNLYIKFMCIFCSEKAANKRWFDFVERIHKYEKGDVQQNYNIKLSHEYDIVLDGSHRLMLAYYFNVDKIAADIYCCDLNRYIEFAENMALTDKQLHEYFSYDEILLIKEADLKLKI
ncbi:hypothetical protein [Paenibacillus xylanexedens]|uniref:hypothetical protein n=1 Tax=Paenibacillus xylanexedens TaxID=528191 RepID=UPI0011A71466|nr:hypothetical protein [Paenibacillus xylanexedens]